MSIFTRPIKPRKLLENLSLEELRALAKHEEQTTEFGSASYITKIRSRSAKFTEIIEQEPNPEQAGTVKKVQEYLRGKEMIFTRRTMCQNPRHQLLCHFYITKEYARVPFMWSQTLFAPHRGGEPDMMVVDVPEWEERKVLVDAPNHITYVLGTDYMGEIKKANLRLAMHIAKLRGGLGLHAGSKAIKINDQSGNLQEKGVLLFGLSGTGKTTLSCHHHFLREPEGVAIRQDDIVLMQPDSACFGTEDNFYIKTEGLEPAGQPILYNAVISPRAVLENVDVEKGRINLEEYGLTDNGRAIVHRRDMVYFDEQIDSAKTDIIIFIVRRDDIVPAVAKLNQAQAAAFFMLGESIETSAGDPKKAGLPIRVVGYNPFIVGSPEEEGNRFLEFLKNNPHLEAYMMNTGRVGGQEGEKITVRHSSEIIKHIARGDIAWGKDRDWGYEVPVQVPDIEISRLNPKRFYNEGAYQTLTAKLKSERREWLDKFSGLRPEIKEALGVYTPSLF